MTRTVFGAPVLCFVLLLVVCNVTNAAPKKDLITNLPGLTFQPTFKQYSGYLQALDGKLLYYWFVESENNPDTDPVVVWLNGGPGCSSLFGLLGQNGPLRVTSEKKIEKNEFAWTKAANMLYLDAPAGVGFSYSKNKSYNTDDDDTAKNNFAALKDFFKKFPEKQKNDLYIAGQHYAGVYIPTLVSLMVDSSAFNLKGFLVGNGLSSLILNENGELYFIAYHGLIAQHNFTHLLKVCCPEGDTSNCDFARGSVDMNCSKLIFQTTAALANLDQFNIYSETPGEDYKSCDPMLDLKKPQGFLGHTSRHIHVCTAQGDKIAAYINQPDVRKALHIPQEVQEWTECTFINYRMQYMDMFAQYKKIMPKKLRIMLYNGDVAAGLNYLGNEWFADALHPKVYPEYKQWFYHPTEKTGIVGGYYKSFGNFTFATVRGAGLMVPQEKPLPALTMFKMFLANTFN